MSDLELITKPDAAMALKRMEHWWEREIIGRPAIQVTAPRTERKALPQSKHASQRDRWMDIDFTLQVASTQIENTYYAGEAMPIFWSNLGPEILSTAYGAELEFGPDTSWSIPCLETTALLTTSVFPRTMSILIPY